MKMDNELLDQEEDDEGYGPEVNDFDRETIAQSVVDGNTSGQFSSGICTVDWKLSIDKF